jgi:uroporphyrinogen III methyltransferase/synthase
VDTLVFLMGAGNLEKIAAKLVENGRASDTPVAVVHEGTRAGQKVVTGTLADIVAKTRAAGLGAPAIIVVGEVVNLREKLRWFDNRPLAGKRILVTRARQQASALSRMLAEKGAEPIELPAIEIRQLQDTSELDAAINNLANYQWLIFTSPNGVEAFFERLKAQSMDSRDLHGLTVGVIGPATAAALQKWGVSPDYMPPVYTTAALLAGLKSLGVAGKRFLLPRADIVDKELSDGLINLRARVKGVTAYRTIAAGPEIEQAKTLLAEGGVDVVTFTSSSTVTNLLQSLGPASKLLERVKVAAIGPKTAETAQKAGLKVDILAREQTIPGLVESIVEYYEKEKEA